MLSPAISVVSAFKSFLLAKFCPPFPQQLQLLSSPLEVEPCLSLVSSVLPLYVYLSPAYSVCPLSSFYLSLPSVVVAFHPLSYATSVFSLFSASPSRSLPLAPVQGSSYLCFPLPLILLIHWALRSISHHVDTPSTFVRSPTIPSI